MHDLTPHLEDIAGGFMPLIDSQVDVAPPTNVAPDPVFRPFRTNG